MRVRTIFFDPRVRLMHISNSTVYNNPKHSDVTLLFGDRRIYAHKVVLRIWSPFFERTFNSKFPVAESNIFVIDAEDDGDYEPLCAVLKHAYGILLGQTSKNMFQDDEKSRDTFEYSIRIYTIADKYDFPSARLAVAAHIADRLDSCPMEESVWHSLRVNHPGLPDHIALVCGPDAPQLADRGLYELLFDWLVHNFGFVSKDPGFRVKLTDGSLLDADLTVELPLELGKRIRDLVDLIRVRDAR
jgi:hypothetical protein